MYVKQFRNRNTTGVRLMLNINYITCSYAPETLCSCREIITNEELVANFSCLNLSQVVLSHYHSFQSY